MSRKKISHKREMLPDPKFGEIQVSKFINALMLDGKKSVAEGILYDAFDLIEKRQKEAPLKVFKAALDNVKPVIEVKSRRVGGSNYQVPMEIRPERRESLGIRWLIDAAKKRPGKEMADKLAGELMDAFAKKGATIKKREETHKMAEANKAFAHYRW